MEIKIKPITPWENVKKAALYTIGKTFVKNTPTAAWISAIVDAEHSPIRERMYHIELIGIPYWVANHFARHCVDTRPYISTSREDRTESGTPRHSLPQSAPVNMLISLNAQSLINISRKRLCNMASIETRDIWKTVKAGIAEIDPMVAACMVAECVYRGGVCHEINGGCKQIKKEPTTTEKPKTEPTITTDLCGDCAYYENCANSNDFNNKVCNLFKRG